LDLAIGFVDGVYLIARISFASSICLTNRAISAMGESMSKIRISESKEGDELPSEEADRRRDDTLRNMLRTKPKPHEKMKKKGDQDQRS